MSSATPLRLTVGIPMAALVTLGQFTAMSTLIRVDEVSIEEKDRVTLARITLLMPSDYEGFLAQSLPARIASADIPPPPPKYAVNKSDIELPAPTFKGAAPTEIPAVKFDKLYFKPVSTGSRDPGPIRAPDAVYPQAAITRQLEGSCEVRFSVDVRGKPFDITPVCTDPVFESEARRAVARSEFAPLVVRGQPTVRTNVLYPLEFRLNQ